MQIDVTKRVDAAKEITRAWADRAGYQKPPEADANSQISEKAKNLRRILGVADFGCQERHVHAICEVLLGEKIPSTPRKGFADYLRAERFTIGSVLVPVNVNNEPRAGLVTRLSGSGNAGLRMSNGAMHNNHFQQRDLRPATDQEIDEYFSEFFGQTVHPDDAASATESMDEEIPF